MENSKTTRKKYLADETELEKPEDFIRPTDQEIKRECILKIYNESIGRFVDEAGILESIPFLPLIRNIYLRVFFYVALMISCYFWALFELEKDGGNKTLVFSHFCVAWVFLNVFIYVEQGADWVKNGKRTSHWLNNNFESQVVIIFLLVTYTVFAGVGTFFTEIRYHGENMMVLYKYKDASNYGIIGAWFMLVPMTVLFVNMVFQCSDLEWTVARVTAAMNSLHMSHVYRINQQIADVKEIRADVKTRFGSAVVPASRFEFKDDHRFMILKYLSKHSTKQAAEVFDHTILAKDGWRALSGEFFEVSVKTDDQTLTVKLKFEDKWDESYKQVLVIETEQEIDGTFFMALFEKSIVDEQPLEMPVYSDSLAVSSLSDDEIVIFDRLIYAKSND